MKNVRFIGLLVLLAVTMTARADRGGFYYKNFHVEAVVHPDNVWEVTETIDVFFEEPRHGIYRYIPLKFTLKHDVSQDEGMEPEVIQGQVVQDWRDFNYVSDVDDISVEGGDFTTEDSNDEFEIIRIGSEWREVEGDHRYVIRYKYIYRDDRRPNYDYIFHTILGTDFGEDIQNFSFRIEFEKPLPADIQNRLEVYSGVYGNTTFNAVENLTIKATQNFIRGKATNIPPNHGITLYAKLPEGYYEGVLTTNHVLYYISFGFSLMLVILIIYYLLRTKRPHVTKVLEFYPPEGISSAEVGTIIDNEVNTIDLASLIPWFAGQGYITIEDEEKEGFLSKKTELTLTKIADLPKDAPSYQKQMMQLLFKKGDTIKLNKLGESPKQVENIQKALKDSFKGKRELNTLRGGALLYFPLLIFTTGMFANNSVVQTFDIEACLVALAFWTVPFGFWTAMRLVKSDSDIWDKKWKRWLFFLIKAILMVGVYYLCSWLTIAYGAPMNKWVMLGVFVVCFLLSESIGFFNVDSEYRIEMIGRLQGFREFIETAEKSRLESLQASDPNYFYKVLPYAMVFDLSDEWAKRFKDINVEKPDWYNSTTPITSALLTTHLTDSIYSATNSAITTVSHDSSSSGGGGFSGGGFSGGGGGGGGGGSW